MYCQRCDEIYFGGSICPACGARLERGRIKFSLSGEPVLHEKELHGVPRQSAREAREKRRPRGFISRLYHKFIESVIACVLLSVAIRVVIFLVKVVDSLVETGGEIKGGISFYTDIRRPVGWPEVAVWLLIFILIFNYRHNPE